MIQFHQTYFTYDNKNLIDNLSLDIKAGEKVVLYGPSGAGKSTILAAILGFVYPESGTIYISNIEQCKKNAPSIRKITSYLPQDLSLPYTTIKEMFFAPFEFKLNRANKPSNEVINNTLASLGLEQTILGKTLTQISGGERQRLLLASTTLLNKPILLLDEPTSALDSESVTRVIEYLHSLDCTMVAVSHDTTFIESFSHKILIPKL